MRMLIGEERLNLQRTDGKPAVLEQYHSNRLISMFTNHPKAIGSSLQVLGDIRFSGFEPMPQSLQK